MGGCSGAQIEFVDDFVAAAFGLLVEQAQGVEGFVLGRHQADDQVLDQRHAVTDPAGHTWSDGGEDGEHRRRLIQVQAKVAFEKWTSVCLDLRLVLLLPIEVEFRRPAVHQCEKFLVGHHLNHADGQHDSQSQQYPTVVAVPDCEY